MDIQSKRNECRALEQMSRRAASRPGAPARWAQQAEFMGQYQLLLKAGGMKAVKAWMEERRAAFAPEQAKG